MFASPKATRISFWRWSRSPPIVGVGLNVLLGLTGQVSLGHVGFYAIGAYTAAILTVKGISFWLAFPAAGADRGHHRRAARAAGAARHRAVSRDGHHRVRLHRPSRHRRVEGPDRRTERPDGPRAARARRARRLPSARWRCSRSCSPVSRSMSSTGSPRAPGARRWSRCATARPRRARSDSIRSAIKTAAFAISAVFAGLAGAIFAPLMMFVAPDSFPFSQSILFLLAVIVGGAGWVFGPVVGAVVTVLLPELLSNLAEYRLLFVGALLLVVLWIAPEGIIGTLARFVRRTDPTQRDGWRGRAFRIPLRRRAARARRFRHRHRVRRHQGRVRCELRRAARPHHQRDRAERRRQDHRAQHDRRLLPPRRRQHPAWRRASLPARRPGASRAPASRAPTRPRSCSATMSVLDNVLVALRRGRLGNPLGGVGERRRPRARRSAARLRRLSRRARHAGERPAACRPAPGRDRARARDAAARAAARRARRRPDARRQGGAQQAHPPHRRPRASPSFWSSTTWRW